MQRAKRKLEHIQYALELGDGRRQRTLLISASYTTVCRRLIRQTLFYL